VPTLQSIEFEECDPDELFGIGWESGIKDDPDFYEVGYGDVPNLTLSSNNKNIVLEEPLILALHAWDQAEELEKDIEIGFWEEDENGKDITIVTNLNKFLDARLPEILKKYDDITDLVLCICNPFNTEIECPKAVPSNVKIHFPLGKAVAFKEDPQEKELNYTLEAEEWIGISKE
jgi:hypothetical protein